MTCPHCGREIDQVSFCYIAVKYSNGKCEGMQKSAHDDEPCEDCKSCPDYICFGED